MKDSSFLAALQLKNKNTPPVWIMRQAGRYMTSYQKLKEKYSFLELCKDPELASHITTLPILEFGFDAAIIFSDILVLLWAFDIRFHFIDGKGVVVENPIETKEDIENLVQKPILSVLSNVKISIGLFLEKLPQTPLIGFAAAPFTLACFLFKGGVEAAKKFMYEEEASFLKLLEKLEKATLEYLEMQVEAKVSAIQLFDTHALSLTPETYVKFSLAFQEKIVKKISEKVPVILFAKGSSSFYPFMQKIKPQAISFDWNSDLKIVRTSLKECALQGNFDPHLLFASKETIKKTVEERLNAMEGDTGYIVNLGHGILPKTKESHVRAFVEAVHCWKPKK